MFLNSLNNDQRKSFLALATKMALADGRVAVQEVAILQELAVTFGHELDVPAEEVYGGINTAPFDNRSSRALTMMAMYFVAHVDEHLHIDESTVLVEVKEAFGFSDADAERLKAWAITEAEVFNAVNAFIDET